jgi:hypothetical protein
MKRKKNSQENAENNQIFMKATLTIIRQLSGKRECEKQYGRYCTLATIITQLFFVYLLFNLDMLQFCRSFKLLQKRTLLNLGFLNTLQEILYQMIKTRTKIREKVFLP